MDVEASPLVTGLLTRLDSVLDELGDLRVGGLADSDVVRLLDATTAASGRLTSVQCRTAADADRRRLGDAIGARHTHQWWAGRSHLTRTEANRLATLGVALTKEQHAPTASALASGTVRTEQARVIVDAVDALPKRVDADIRAKAESMLLDLATQHDAKDLKQLGKQILDFVAPEIGEAHEAAVLEAEETRAFADAELTLTDDGEGRCYGRFVLPSHVGKVLKRHLHALANPARHTDEELKDANGDWKPLRHRLGEAFIEYVERYPLEATPQTGGVNATVVVTMTLEQLLGESAAAAILDDGTRISAGVARRLACEAGIIPAVLDGASQPLDLGRTRRLHTTAQRVALGIRDGGCTARGCETTASGCHAHHDDPWSKGGRTDVNSGRLLCPHHHRLAHNTRYVTTIHADNTVTFILRT